jgi:hypothetical protein
MELRIGADASDLRLGLPRHGGWICTNRGRMFLTGILAPVRLDELRETNRSPYIHTLEENKTNSRGLTSEAPGRRDSRTLRKEGQDH